MNALDPKNHLATSELRCLTKKPFTISIVRTCMLKWVWNVVRADVYRDFTKIFTFQPIEKRLPVTTR